MGAGDPWANDADEPTSWWSCSLALAAALGTTAALTFAAVRGWLGGRRG